MEKLTKIKMIVMDVDGVLTDGKIYFTSSGEKMKAFDIQDGMAITLAREAGLKTGIITGRSSDIVTRRAVELKYDIVLQGNDDKLSQYEKIKTEFNLTDEEICYIGDDIPDIPVLKKAGFSVAVANARDQLKQFCDFVTERDGGHSAVREVIDKILLSQGKIL
jgi:3-deoxy-D-manno-octulosonate 8-phosphate phosphatase (KDO 8-P phosphatase)